MARFIKGDVVVVPFPFSDLSQTKRRPALVLSVLDGDDVLLCQITSQSIKDRYAISLTAEDFESGGLKRPSNIRPNRIFTAESNLILYTAGHIQSSKLNEVVQRATEIIQE